MATVVMGSLWGDEGKGKILDYLCEDVDMVIRAGGGNNAGHTIIIGEQKYALHLIPSGVLHPNILNILGDGMVIDPFSLEEEMNGLIARGINCENVRISDRAQVVLPFHPLLDAKREEEREYKIGTTHKGIGPAYKDKIAREGYRMIDFLEASEEGIRARLLLHEELFKQADREVEHELKELLRVREVLRSKVRDTSAIVHEFYKDNKKILLEGAQGALLDVTYGTYPYVTSSNPISGGFCVGSGLAPHAIGDVIGVSKSYCTRVGAGPFVTELNNEIGDRIREAGHEYGTTTGRPRRCGYLDGVALKYSVRISGITQIALTLLDVLSGFEEIALCVAYEIDGERTQNYPASIKQLEKAKPIYKTFKGFSEDITTVRSFEDLPKEAKEYIYYLEEYLGIPVSIVSVGPDREQTMIRK